MKLEELSTTCHDIMGEVERVIVEKDEVISQRALGCLERVKEDLLREVQKVEEEEDERV